MSTAARTVRTGRRGIGWLGRRALGATAAVTAASLFLGGMPAVAAPTDDSEAFAEWLSTELLTPDLVTATTSQSGYPSAPGADNTPLNVGLFDETLTVDLGGGLVLPLVSQPGEAGLLDLGELGALNSFASSQTGNTSTASSGAVGSDGAIDLDPADPASTAAPRSTSPTCSRSSA